MLCANCGKEVPEGYAFCPNCGRKLGRGDVSSRPPRPSAEEIAEAIRTDTRTSAILWIVIGSLQILGCVTIIAGVWDLILGIRRLNLSKTIAPGNEEVYRAFDGGMTDIIITVALNVLLGGMIFALLCIWDYFIRDRVLLNASVFRG
ncbi:MAG TPA: zinc-ribbon domain-containing protein [Oscillospiraceae bacterium]|nr:zinc-ribbon domain-containing protein [Oscillospiraceae bacterium]HXK77250.1 zinc-ribbon domain-containing protein [Oscillospiraceae bacterium]